jgi:Na+/phosphate symporter
VDATKTPLPGAQNDDVVAMCDEILRAFLRVREAFTRLDPAPLDEASRLVRLVHKQEHELIQRMVKAAAAPGIPSEADEEAIFVPMHLERVGDNIELLGAAIGRMIREGILFTDRGTSEVRRLLVTVLEVLECLRDGLRTGNRTILRFVRDNCRVCEAQANEFAMFHEQRLIEGVCQPKASSTYLAMLDHFRGIEWHARQVAEKLSGASVGA